MRYLEQPSHWDEIKVLGAYKCNLAAIFGHLDKVLTQTARFSLLMTSLVTRSYGS